ncbi:MAG: hypothetical protein MUC31_03100 [Bacteroidales bacterium]|nr:hypothetical protein [Bacteroidales bacterium]
MKKQLFYLTMAVVLAISVTSCKEDENAPSVTTATVSSITSTTATTGGEITDEGTSAVTARGVCWSTNQDPTVNDSKTSDGTGVGAYTSTITGLNPGTLYHVRAYATNGEGTNYGADIQFSTASLIKTTGIVYTDGTDLYEFSYDAQSRVDTIINYWNDELDKTLYYDFSVPGMLTIDRNGDLYEYELDDQGRVVIDADGSKYEYDAEGFLVKMSEYWDNAFHLKYQMEIQNGNVFRITTFDDDGVTVKRIKEFFYTSGLNVNGIDQVIVVDSPWKTIGGLYGKVSKNLVDYLEYWDPRENPIVKGRTTITYDFDDKDRPTTITRSGDGWQEVYTYTYY